jgi:hypothetical protein
MSGNLSKDSTDQDLYLDTMDESVDGGGSLGRPEIESNRKMIPNGVIFFYEII